jgi:hypothetical protein
MIFRQKKNLLEWGVDPPSEVRVISMFAGFLPNHGRANTHYSTLSAKGDTLSVSSNRGIWNKCITEVTLMVKPYVEWYCR